MPGEPSQAPTTGAPGTAEAPSGVAGEASPPPLGFTLVLWVGAFSVVLWVMLRWFGRVGGRPGPD